MSDRKLVTLERVRAIAPIPDADAIETVTVRDWKVVVKKGAFTVGEAVIYFELDCLLPLDDERFAFLAPRGSKTVEGRNFHVLRTAKLRGQYSQGLVLPVALFPEVPFFTQFGDDLSVHLSISKWEAPVPAELSGQVVGPFPTSLILKTDAERVQNLGELYPTLASNPDGWDATEKIDGTSCTFLNVDGDPRLCSRNWELVWDDALTQVRVAERDDLVPSPGWAIQAELFGEGIQANPLRITGQRLAVFNVLRLVDGRFLPVPRESWPERFAAHAAPALDLILPVSAAEAVAQVDGLRSKICPDRLAEGVVWHHRAGITFSELEGRECFKAINNAYLLKHGG